jgi:hypothetical protein
MVPDSWTPTGNGARALIEFQSTAFTLALVAEYVLDDGRSKFMMQMRRLLVGTVVAAGVFAGGLAGTVAPAQAQIPSTGLMGGSGGYPATGSYPTGVVTVAQFPAAGHDPPYNATTLGVASGPDLTVTLGRADGAPPIAGTFPMAFMTSQPPAPISR